MPIASLATSTCANDAPGEPVHWKGRASAHSETLGASDKVPASDNRWDQVPHLQGLTSQAYLKGGATVIEELCL